jgi:undecaprenyl phosphate N,N'-diacetylbacillosamine 1-phosphate transferase
MENEIKISYAITVCNEIEEIKRLIDFLAALSLLIVLCPILFLLIVILGVFKQERPGKNGEIFTIYKIRTMSKVTHVNGIKLKDVERFTSIGRIIRKLSLDELPQLWNVVKGEMSFVGPRPLLPKYLPLYSSEQAKRHNVRPGITGWAQVNGRNAISWEEKFKYDVYYVDHISLLLDLKVLWLTVMKVLKREGINSSENITMGEFNGEN